MMRSLVFALILVVLNVSIAHSSNAQLDEIERKCTMEISRKLDSVMHEVNGLKSLVSSMQSSNDNQWQQLHERFFQSEVLSGRHTVPSGKCKDICRVSGEQDLHLQKLSKAVKIFCDSDGYLVVLQRFDGSIPFHSKNWQAYKNGFGVVKENSEFFLGLQNLHDITDDGDKFELKIELEDFDGVKKYAKYSAFSVGTENDAFQLGSLGQYYGTAGDSFSYHQGQKFTTLDRDNDAKTVGSCGEQFNSAGWFKACMESNIMGRYFKQPINVPIQEGVYWETFHGPEYSLKKVKMSIRAVC